MTHKPCSLRLLVAALALGACGKVAQPSAPANVVQKPETQRWLLEDGKRAEIAGAEPARVLIAEAGAVGDRFSSVVEVSAQDCLLVMARGSEKIVDLDLYTYAEDGTVLAVDDKPNAKPVLLVCPPHPKHVYLTVRIAAGQGLVAMGVHRVAANDANPVRHALQIASENLEETAVPPERDLESRITSHHQLIGGNWVAVAQSSMAVDSRVPTVTGLTIQENSCLDLLVVPPPRVVALEIELLDERGYTLGRAPMGDRDRWLVACSKEQRSVTLQVRPHEGSGTATLLMSRGTLEMGRSIRQVIELSDGQSLRVITEAEHKALEKLGYAREKVLDSFSIERGFQRRFVTNGARSCTRFDIFAGAPSLGVQARLYTASGELLSAAGGLAHFPLLACSEGRMTMVIETQGRGGPVQIEQRQESSNSPYAINLPRAAARMFQRAWYLGKAKTFSQFKNLESIPLTDERVWERELKLDAGHCFYYFMSLDGDASGIDLRIVDAKTDEIMSGERHIDTAHAEICAKAGNAPHVYRITATVQSGKSLALLSTLSFP
jgi:hypothetical protein